jgi:arylamine N-acetyltransferase
MRKSDKKIDNQIRHVLTDFCENTLKQFDGFNWITHTVNYSNFPQSLHITVVFQDSNSLLLFKQNHQHKIENQLSDLLNSTGINIRLIKHLVSYDTINNE